MPPASSGAVVFDAVSKTFTSSLTPVHAVTDVTLAVPPSSIQGIIGWSGAGKSTLIRMANGLDTPTSGEVLIEGERLSALAGARLREAKKRTAMVFQHFNLLQSATVAANVAMPLLLDGASEASRERRVAEVLDFVGLAERASAHPDELSGGQKQRVGIARALVRNPSVLLCDEATSALDPATTAQIVDLLKRVNTEFGTTILVVTHEMDVIKDLCDSVAVMEDGRVVESGDVLDLFITPTHPTTRRFVESVVPRAAPASLLEHGADGEVWRLIFTGDGAGRPLISHIAREIGIDFNILAATITEIHSRTVGHLLVRAAGPAPELARAVELLTAHGVHVDIEEER